MKHFTPELLARYRSGDDAAAEEWEQAIEAYEARLAAIRSRLPAGAKRLLETRTLHDARMLGFSDCPEKPVGYLLIQLEGSATGPGEVLELRYHLVAGPRGGWTVKGHPALRNGDGRRPCILYDEFDIEDDGAFFLHSLLLSDGKVMIFRFHNLHVRTRTVRLGTEGVADVERTWPLVGA